MGTLLYHLTSAASAGYEDNEAASPLALDKELHEKPCCEGDFCRKHQLAWLLCYICSNFFSHPLEIRAFFL